MVRTFAALVIALVPTATFADDFADGQAAHKKGDFKWQKKADEMGYADDKKTKELAEKLLKLYEEGKPYRDE